MPETQYQEVFFTDWPNDAFGVLTASPGGTLTIKNSVKSIVPGLRERKFYFAPVLAPDIVVGGWNCIATFFKNGEIATQLKFGTGGNDASGGYSVLTSVPFHGITLTTALNAPVASDPESRVVNHNDATAPAWYAQFTLNPTKFLLDADSFQIDTRIFILSAMSVARPVFLHAGVVSGYEKPYATMDAGQGIERWMKEMLRAAQGKPEYVDT